jgi:hypothetical protein
MQVNYREDMCESMYNSYQVANAGSCDGVPQSLKQVVVERIAEIGYIVGYGYSA